MPITTAGDRDRTKPFGQIGERGVFVKEIEEALLEGRIDVAVHSAKDMTSTDTEGLAVGAYLPREDPRDALCGADGLRPGMRVGTASVRRRAQLLALEPTLSIEPLRGNIDTRLRKRGERGLDAVVLAACGLDRLGLADEIGHPLRSRPECCPRPGRARWRCRCARARRSSSATRTTPRRAAGSKPSAPAWPRSAAAASLPIAAYHDGETLTALVADRGRPLDRAAHRRRPDRAGRRAAPARRRVKVIVTRPREQAGPLVARLEELGHEVVECPLIEIEPLGDEPSTSAATTG